LFQSGPFKNYFWRKTDRDADYDTFTRVRNRNAQSNFVIGQRVRISRTTGAPAQPDIREAEGSVHLCPA
jgi:hypothetical protein